MIQSSSVRAYVSVEPVDMRKQIDGLAQMVESVFAADAFSGRVFVFLGKRPNQTTFNIPIDLRCHRIPMASTVR